MLTQDVILKFKEKVTTIVNTTQLNNICPNYKIIADTVLVHTDLYIAKTAITYSDLENLLRNRKKTKYRWLKADVDNNLTINMNTKNKVNKCLEWLDDSVPLIAYANIKNKSIKSINSCIKNDFTVELYKIILNYTDSDIVDSDIIDDTDDIIDNLVAITTCKDDLITQDSMIAHSYNDIIDNIKKEKRAISKVSNVLTTIPYNTNKDGSFEKIGKTLSEQLNDVEYSENSMMFKNYRFTIEFNDNEPRTRLQLRNDENIKKVLNRINQLLNSTDRKIYNYLISQVTSEFINTGSVLLSMRDIAENVFEGGKSGDNYLGIKSSIFKMEKIKCYLGNGKSSSVIGLISAFEFFTDKDNRDLVQVDIHPYIRDEIIKKHTINLYKDIIDNCPDDDTELLMYFLQRKRLSLVLGNKPLEIKVDYLDFFSNAIYFTNKRHDRNITRLLKCLDFIKNTNSIINDYTRYKNSITLKFKSISKGELSDLNYEDIFDEKFTEFRDKLLEEPSFYIS